MVNGDKVVMEIVYPAIVTPEPGGGFVVRFADLDEAFTKGETLDEALFKDRKSDV